MFRKIISLSVTLLAIFFLAPKMALAANKGDSCDNLGQICNDGTVCHSTGDLFTTHGECMPVGVFTGDICDRDGECCANGSVCQKTGFAGLGGLKCVTSQDNALRCARTIGECSPACENTSEICSPPPFNKCEVICNSSKPCLNGKECTKPSWMGLSATPPPGYPVNLQTCSDCVCSATTLSATCKTFCNALKTQPDCAGDDSKCKQYEICVSGTLNNLSGYSCQEGCRTDSGCPPATPVCSPTTHSCVTQTSVDAYKTKADAYTAAITPGLGTLGCSFQANDAGALIGLIGKIFVQGTVLIGLDTLAGTINEGGPTILGEKLPAGLGEGFSDAMDWLFKTWLAIVLWGLVATVAVIAGSGLIQAGLDLNSNFLTVNNVVVTTGHGIILTIANIGFVIALVIMGIMVILRRKEWDIGKTIPRFVAAVTLVNFGLFISNVLIDISSTVMKGFIGDQCMGWFLYHAFSMPSLNEAFSQSGLLSGLTGGPISVFGVLLGLLSLVLSTIFSVIGALTVFTIVAFLLIRYVVVSVLLVFMPLAWLGFAVPKLTIPSFGNPWGYWWKQFTQWLIFGPLIAFFLYLGSLLSTSIGEMATNNAYPLVGLIQTITVIIISAGGLFVASKMSAIGGNLITTGVGLAAGGAIAGMRKLGGGAFRRQIAAQEKLKQEGLSAGEKRKLRFQAAAFRGVGTAATAKMGVASKGLKKVGIGIKEQKPLTAETFAEEQVKKHEERYKGLTPEQKARRYEWLAQTPKLGVEKRMALMKQLKDAKKLGLIKNKDDALSMKERFELTGAKFKEYEIGLGTNAKIRAAEKGYVRTKEIGERTVAAAAKQVTTAGETLKDLAYQQPSKQNKLQIAENNLTAASRKPGSDNMSYDTTKRKHERNDKDLAFENLNLSRAKNDVENTKQEVSRVQGVQSATVTKHAEAKTTAQRAQTELDSAEKLTQNIEKVAKDTTKSATERSQASTQLATAVIERDKRKVELDNAMKAEADASTQLATANTDLASAKGSQTIAENTLKQRTVSQAKAEKKYTQSKTEFETATTNRAAYQKAEAERDTAKTELDDLNTRIQQAQTAKTNADQNLTQVKTTADDATTAELGRVKKEADKWFDDISAEDKKGLPLDNIVTGFKKDESPMDTDPGHSAVQSALVEKTLERGGKGAINSLLNVKSANFDAVSKKIIEEVERNARVTVTDINRYNSAAKGQKSKLGFTQKQIDAINAIINTNNQRISRGHNSLI